MYAFLHLQSVTFGAPVVKKLWLINRSACVLRTERKHVTKENESIYGL